MPTNQRNPSVITRSAKQSQTLNIQPDNSRKRNSLPVPATPRQTHPGQPKDILVTSITSPPSSPEQHTPPPSPPIQIPQLSYSHKVVNHSSTNR
jgi:hypothetical protein